MKGVMAESPTRLALDFDGVICDGLSEYFQTSWRVYRQIWPGEPDPPGELEPLFQRLRPVIETGWEMPVLLQALLTGVEEAQILTAWPQIAGQILQEQGLDPDKLAQQIDNTRDQWIETDFTDWIRYHRLYPGVGQQLHQWLTAGSPEIWIITTKEGRFAHQILSAQGVDLPRERIIGKESGVPKSVSLRRLLAVDRRIWFVEDRLKTLQLVQAEVDLQEILLFLAEWGYVTEADRQSAQRDPRIQLLSLDRFNQRFDQWLR